MGDQSFVRLTETLRQLQLSSQNTVSYPDTKYFTLLLQYYDIRMQILNYFSSTPAFGQFFFFTLVRPLLVGISPKKHVTACSKLSYPETYVGQHDAILGVPVQQPNFLPTSRRPRFSIQQHGLGNARRSGRCYPGNQTFLLPTMLPRWCPRR